MKIFDYEEVKMNWDSFTYPIAVGTPVSVDGVLADNSSAHGLIARTVFAKPDGGDTLKIMTGGFIDMEEIVAGYGQELSSAAVQALCGIHFYKEGVCIPTGGSGGGSDDQKWHETTVTPLFSETVTTVAEGTTNVATLSYAEPITADTLKVTFNGVDYICTKRTIEDSTSVEYGAPYNAETDGYDFSEYPFNILSSDIGEANEITSETPGTYTVSVSTESVTTTDTFKQAVNDIAGWKTENETEIFNDTVTVLEPPNPTILDITEELPETITVIFDGVEYTCNRRTTTIAGTTYCDYGAELGVDTDWSQYPFAITQMIGGDGLTTSLSTETLGDHTVIIKGGNTVYTETFIEAVKSIVNGVEEVATPDLADIAVITPNSDISYSYPLLLINGSTGAISSETQQDVFTAGTVLILYRHNSATRNNFSNDSTTLSALGNSLRWVTKSQVSCVDNVWSITGSATLPTTNVNIRWYSLSLPHDGGTGPA